MASNYNNDKILKAIDKEENAAIKESDKTFDGMINQSDKLHQDQINATNQWGETQAKNQQDRTDFTIEQIEQQKDQAYKDFQKEGSAAYVDWQKQTDDYGSNAEKMASMGLAHSGYSEQSKVAMYNAYQNRVASARESYNKAVLSYDNAIKDARLQNNSALAEIAYNTLQKSLELSLQGFQYKNDLVLQKAQAKREIDNTFYSRYQDRIAQINHENSMAEQIRQYNQNYQLDLKKYNESIRQFNVEIARLKAQDKAENKYKIQQLELQKKQLQEEKRQFNENLAWQKKKSNLSSGSGSGGNTRVTTKKGKDMPEKVKYAKRDTSEADKKKALSKVKKVKTKSAAQSLLKSLGIKPGTAIIDSVAWNKAKRMGDGGSDIQKFKNYAAYVQWYCTSAINGEF